MNMIIGIKQSIFKLCFVNFLVLDTKKITDPRSRQNSIFKRNNIMNKCISFLKNICYYFFFSFLSQIPSRFN